MKRRDLFKSMLAVAVTALSPSVPVVSERKKLLQSGGLKDIIKLLGDEASK